MSKQRQIAPIRPVHLKQPSHAVEDATAPTQKSPASTASLPAQGEE